jgi:hypothetical protein
MTRTLCLTHHSALRNYEINKLQISTVSKFNIWAKNLYLCLDVNDHYKELLDINLQQDGGFQNTYICCRRDAGGVLVDKTKKEEIFQVSTDDDKVFKGGSEIDDDNL